ncbi:MAG: hypothetical protein A2014_02780 [Spirochaetes bacterium GWF1_49_6]|nr:MAG: hypothetical protein A2014_02780 [Spirochaetes bacterium GWF1_49_6]
MQKVVIITGSSSGIGMETALYFAKNDWMVLATMRNPENCSAKLWGNPNIEIIPLDVTDKVSIRKAVDYAINKFREINALINNAGYGLIGPFESLPVKNIRMQYDTNVFGLMELTRYVLPFMRVQKDGTIVNISSIGGKMGMPLYSAYNSTKWALEGYSEALYYELIPFNIRIKIIEPGLIYTNFYKAIDMSEISDWGEYRRTLGNSASAYGSFPGSHPEVVAKTIFKAVSGRSKRLRYPVGGMAKPIMFLKRHLPENFWTWLFKNFLKLNI